MRYKIVIDSCGELVEKWKDSPAVERASLTLTVDDEDIIDDDTKLIDHCAIVMDPAYVHIEKETDQKIKALFNDFAKNNIYCIGRYGAWTYCSMEDCMLQAKNLYEKLS